MRPEATVSLSMPEPLVMRAFKAPLYSALCTTVCILYCVVLCSRGPNEVEVAQGILHCATSRCMERGVVGSIDADVYLLL